MEKFLENFTTFIKFNNKASLINEIKLLRTVDHPNLIHLEAVYESENNFYLVLEICSGGNLKEYIKQNKLVSQEKSAYIMKNVLEGLQALHNKNIMHRDIKPENILFKTSNFLEENGQIILADFGLATSNDVSNYLLPRCGTPGFVAPEILLNDDPDVHYSLKCDLFSVGVTLFMMLTGRMPYEGEENRLIENMEFDFNLKKHKGFNFLSSEGIFTKRTIKILKLLKIFK